MVRFAGRQELEHAWFLFLAEPSPASIVRNILNTYSYFMTTYLFPLEREKIGSHEVGLEFHFARLWWPGSR